MRFHKHLALALLLPLWFSFTSPGIPWALPGEPRAERAPAWCSQERPGEPTDECIIQLIIRRLSREVHPTVHLGEPDAGKDVPLPVGVVREDLSEDHPGVMGYTVRCGPGFMIHLDSALHGELLAEVLVHEWAHTLHFEDDATTDDEAHGDTWGVDYARCYRAAHHQP